jgi:hypothetical protein
VVVQPGADDTFTLHLTRSELLQLFAALTYLHAPTQTQRELRGQLRELLRATEVTPRDVLPEGTDSAGAGSGEFHPPKRGLTRHEDRTAGEGKARARGATGRKEPT